MLFRATPGPDQFGVLQSLFYLAMPVLGGAEALLGAVVGGIFLATGQPMVNVFDVRLYPGHQHRAAADAALRAGRRHRDAAHRPQGARRRRSAASRSATGRSCPTTRTEDALAPAGACARAVSEPIPVGSTIRVRFVRPERTRMSGHLIGHRLTKRYSGLVANDGVDIEVRPGEIVGLIGPNGAGKTTCFNCLTGAQSLTSGRVVLNGKDITKFPAAERARLGMARTFQQAQLFRHLSVEENLLLGRHRRYGAGALRGALGPGRGAEREARRIAHAVADQCGLTPVLGAPVGDLPYGTQRMVEVARAIVLEPEVLLVDEPARRHGQPRVGVLRSGAARGSAGSVRCRC